MCSPRADRSSARIVCNSPAFRVATACWQSSRILSSSRLAGIPAPQGNSIHGSAACAIRHTVYFRGKKNGGFWGGQDGIPRLSPAWDFLLTPAAPSFIECADDPCHPPLRLRSGQAFFAKCAKRMGHLALNSCPCPRRRYWLRSTPEYRENSLTRLGHGGKCRGPFGFAQGRLFDFAWTSLREVHAALRMTTFRKVREKDGHTASTDWRFESRISAPFRGGLYGTDNSGRHRT